jgi:hypothetical protein
MSFFDARTKPFVPVCAATERVETRLAVTGAAKNLQIPVGNLRFVAVGFFSANVDDELRLLAHEPGGTCHVAR